MEGVVGAPWGISVLGPNVLFRACRPRMPLPHIPPSVHHAILSHSILLSQHRVTCWYAWSTRHERQWCLLPPPLAPLWLRMVSRRCVPTIAADFSATGRLLLDACGVHIVLYLIYIHPLQILCSYQTAHIYLPAQATRRLPYEISYPSHRLPSKSPGCAILSHARGCRLLYVMSV